MSSRKGNRLILVPETEVSGTTARIYSEIKALLGIEQVPMAFQAFAASPKFFELLWRTIQPLLQTRELFQLAGRLRAETYTRVHNYFPVPDMEHFAKAHQLTEVLDLLTYIDPVIFLLLTAEQQSFDGAVGSPGTSHPAEGRHFSTRLEPVEYMTAPPETRKIYDEIRRYRKIAFIDTNDRILARFSPFFNAYWGALKSILQSPLYEPSQLAIREAAYALAQELPVSIELEYARMAEHGLNASEIAGVVRLTESLVSNLSCSLLNTTVAKIAIEGGNRPRTSVPILTAPVTHHPKSAA